MALVAYGGLCLGLAWCWVRARALPHPRVATRVLLLWLAAWTMIGSSLSASIRFMHSDYVRKNRSTFRQVVEWYRDAARPEDKILVTLWRIVSYYSGRPAGEVLHSGWLASSSLNDLMNELKAKGVTYIVWDNLYGRSTSYDAKRYKAHLLSLLRREYPEGLELVKRFQAGAEEAIVYRFHPPLAPTDPSR